MSGLDATTPKNQLSDLPKYCTFHSSPLRATFILEHGKRTICLITPTMDATPRKRRKTSPTASVPVDAPTTPSRIPVRKEGTQPLSGRPSFASPTKASISKHHPQLLRRPSSAGAGTERPGSRGRDIQDVFTRALGEPRPSIEGHETPLAQAFKSTTPRASGHRRARSDGGGLSAKPRRMSRSPFNQAPKRIETIEQQNNSAEEMQENIVNPFAKKGLRRSPADAAVSQATGVLQDLPEQSINPFEKRGLRRSPVSSQAVEAAGEILGRTEALPEASTTTTEPKISTAIEPLVLKDPQLPREPDPITTQEYPTQSTEQISIDNFERHEEPQLPTKIVEERRSWEAVEPIALPNPRQQRERHLEESSRRPTHSSHTAEPVTFNRRQPEELELPPTPTQLGILDPVVTTPPTGIHDTPSKRARKKSQTVKSSPLKPRDPPPPVQSKTAKPESQSKSKKPPNVQRRRSSRFLVPEDPHASKKKTRDDLLKELQQLQEDVALGNQENERLRLQYESRKLRPTTPSNSDELLDMLLRATAPEPAAEPKPKLASIFKSMDAFLPFTSRRKRQAASLPTLDKPIPSHLPIALDDPLPYLQVFSPLIYTSNITLLPPEPISPDKSVQEADQPILQRHLIKTSHPPGLFSARLSMTVDSSLLSITSLDIEALPSNAEKELGTFIRERSNPEAILNRDIGVICWAMGRWVEVSVSRARFWCTVEQEFGTAEARSNSLQRKVQKRKRRRLLVIDEDDGTDHDGHYDEDIRKQKCSMRQLLPHMGRTAMELSNDEVQLRFEWNIEFDWTGEAESSISVSAMLPKSCEFPFPFRIQCTNSY